MFIDQITKIIELKNEIVETSNKHNSKIIKKEIYSKEIKDLKMVKKYFIWGTNSSSDDYPKFVFYKIDYSPSRGDKLRREIKVSNIQTQIKKIFSDQIKTDIKKGWKLIKN